VTDYYTDESISLTRISWLSHSLRASCTGVMYVGKAYIHKETITSVPLILFGVGIAPYQMLGLITAVLSLPNLGKFLLVIVKVLVTMCASRYTLSHASEIWKY